MRVLAIAATGLLIDPAGQFGYSIEESGYRMHPFELGVTALDELAEAAGRQCYESWGRPNPETASNLGYFGNIIGHGHFSVFEHGTCTLLCQGIGRDTLLELERHRHVSWSVVSTRYVDMYLKGMTNPKAFEEIDVVESIRLAARFKESWELAHDVYRDTFETLVREGKPRKQAREAARKILPTSTETSFFVTGNIRAWREIYQKRSDVHADAEVQEFAEKMMAEVARLAPNSVQDLYPPQEDQ